MIILGFKMYVILTKPYDQISSLIKKKYFHKEKKFHNSTLSEFLQITTF